MAAPITTSERMTEAVPTLAPEGADMPADIAAFVERMNGCCATFLHYRHPERPRCSRCSIDRPERDDARGEEK